MSNLSCMQSNFSGRRFVFEVEAIQIRDGDVHRCAPLDADMWSVYQRPIAAEGCGSRLASWVADFGSEQDAQAFAALKSQEATS